MSIIGQKSPMISAQKGKTIPEVKINFHIEKSSIFKNAESFFCCGYKGSFCFGRKDSQWYMSEYFLRSVARFVTR